MSALVNWSEKIERRLIHSAIWPILLAGFAGSAAIFMFLVHVVAVRVLSTAEYGEFSSAVALVGIIGVGATSVQAVTVKQLKNPNARSGSLLEPMAEVGVLFVATTAVGVVSHVAMRVSMTTSILLALWVPSAVLLARANGYVQARELQVLLNGVTALSNVGALAATCMVAALSAGVAQLLLGRLIVTIATAILLLVAVRDRSTSRNGFVSLDLVSSTLIVSAMWFAANLDVLLGRALLDREDVGQIAVAAMLVNSVLLMPGLIAAVVYPKVVAHSLEPGHLRRLLVNSVLLAGVLQIGFALCLRMTSGWLVDWLAGSDHDVAKAVIFPLALAYIPLGMCIVLTQFVLAIGRFVDSFTYVLLVCLAALGMTTATESAQHFVSVLNASAWFLTAGLTVQVLFRLRGVHAQAQSV